MIGAEDGLSTLLFPILMFVFVGDVIFNGAAVDAQFFCYPAHAVALSMECQNVHEYLRADHGKSLLQREAYHRLAKEVVHFSSRFLVQYCIPIDNCRA